MSASVNPLLPTAYDLIWSGIVAVLLAVTVAAIVSIVRHAKQLSGASYVLWVLVVLLAPVLGVALWFVFGRPKVRETAGVSAG